MTFSINPATGETLATHFFDDDSAIDGALDRAAAAQRRWAEIPIGERAAAIGKVAAGLRSEVETLAQTITAEMGKPIEQARAEVEKCAVLCDWYRANGAALLADEAIDVGGDGEALVAWQPVGVVYGVMPWNFPLWQVLRAAVPILLGGNGFVLKHSDNVQLCARRLIEVMEGAGLPAGLIVNLHVPTEQVTAIVDDPRIAAVTVTSGLGAGSAIAAAAGAALKKSVLELGGSDPFVVLADADIDKAAEAAVKSRYLNTGQVCIAAKRIIVERAILDDFTRRFIERTEALVMGDPRDEATFLGPLARERGRDALQAQVEKSIAEGAVLALGGKPAAGVGSFYPATVLTGVTSAMTAAREELFGPVAAIMAAADAEEAIAIANASDYGLSGALWCGDPERARRLARRIEVGATFVNGISASDPRVPIGGMKRSGYGRELAWFGPREFANPHLIWAR
ncbi:acyl-CoA reductase-like NAD-dependent aldehyde dehydrogenase [Sphingomonas jinjuensis]|uniref:Acyl-CoA reductase-like NAD-dependent aldehyde dehydrogenase n=1 Tax=Sphingomonas jinjuensis TaxID=535907 RepID=A0A840F2J9_9SPHN|nr:aldehyde dehydrogenase family protein [Sphingomonas jinjuensis]MBB4153573.1 acyl-CoA reductase-like NAD-dependent aldehyde dehydrogenase [Sphingomonas jinjuensis]